MSRLILVTGSTGYIATRLIPALLSRGYRVRCLARNPEKLRNRPWKNQVEIFQGDVLNADTLMPALTGVSIAYYLVHNMSSGLAYRENESNSAHNFSEAASRSGLEHIIYLGGLGGSGEFRHMRSRQETGQILRLSGVPITEFRSSVIIGSGSISFEMIRYITTWFPFIPAPIQTNVLGQPIGIKDLLAYLLSALELPGPFGQVVEIGGLQALPYPDLMVEFACQRGLDRPKLFLPFFNALFFAWIADRFTPVPFVIARPLMEELTAPSIVKDQSSNLLFPLIDPSPYSDCVKSALAREEYLPGSPWTASLVTRDSLIGAFIRTIGEGFLIEHREKPMANPPKATMELLNGRAKKGWEIEEGRTGSWVRLRSNKQLPGVLRVEIQHREGLLMQSTMFEPNGLPGLLWWYILLPAHTNSLEKMFNQLAHDQ
jgi:uncharacterized protein YbjT (DUF2867 family)